MDQGQEGRSPGGGVVEWGVDQTESKPKFHTVVCKIVHGKS